MTDRAALMNALPCRLLGGLLGLGMAWFFGQLTLIAYFHHPRTPTMLATALAGAGLTGYALWGALYLARRTDAQV